MHIKKAVPKDAAAVILTRENSSEVFLAQRNPKIKFLGGWHAFPGGKVDHEDALIKVENCSEPALEKFIVAAARETFEETGVLLARGGDKITKGQRASLHDDLTSGRFSFAEILETWGLRIDAADFQYAGFWTTPKFSPVRFKTHFFAACCPRKQEPQVFGEFTSGGFTTPGEALRKWRAGELLISPPVLLSLKILAESSAPQPGAEETDSATDKETQTQIVKTQNSDALQFQASRSFGVEKLLAESQSQNGEILHIKFNSFVTVFPVRSDTLPPATHTNCFIIGERRFVIIDPGSPYAEEQKVLHEYTDSLIEAGGEIVEIILTHLHTDHTAGAEALQNHLKEKFGLKIPIAAHRATAESLKDKSRVERLIEGGEILNSETGDGETFDFVALHTPGHARGHLCFYFEKIGFLLAGDNVISTGSVLIASPEGNMIEYLNSLEEMKNLPNLRFLCGSHGAAIFDARRKIENFIEHRLEREKQIIEAINKGSKSTREIVRRVYADTPSELWTLAEKSVEAHLEKIRMENGLITN